MSTTSDATTEFLTDLFNRRGSFIPVPLVSTVWLFELFGYTPVEMGSARPDPEGYHEKYFYDTLNDVLLIKATSTHNNLRRAVWKTIGGNR